MKIMSGIDERSLSVSNLPTGNSEVSCIRTLDTWRHLYNESLAERKQQAELNRVRKIFDVFTWGKPQWIFYEDQANNLTAIKDSYQKQVHSQVLQVIGLIYNISLKIDPKTCIPYL